MNYINIIKAVAISLLFLVLTLLCGRSIYNQKIKLSISTIIICLLYVAIFLITYLMQDKTILIASQIFMTFIIHKFVFKSRLPKAITGILINYFILLLLKLVTLPLFILLKKYEVINFFTMENTYIYNIIIFILNYIFIIIFNKIIRRVINKYNFYTDNNINWIVIISILLILIILFKVPIINGGNVNAIISTIIIIYMEFMTIEFIKQKNTIDNYRMNYQELAKYSKFNEELLDEYKKLIHDDKNQFLVLKNMLKDNDKNSIKYIDKIIKDKTNYTNNYLQIKELNYIPILSIRGLLNYKIKEIKDKNINIELIISNELRNIELDNVTSNDIYALYMLIRILLDNSIEEASKSEERQICIQIYIEKKDLCITIGNTFKDNKKRKETTQSKNKMTESLIIENIVNEIDNLVYKTKIIDNFFIQTVSLKNK